jgi:hypothetical protein
MRRGTFFILPAALFLLGAGCLSPTNPPEEPPAPDSPLGLLQAFEWCYDHQDEALYAEILDPDFTGHLDGEEGGEIWGRDEELARFAELCAACDEGDIDLDLDFSECGDIEPDPGDAEFRINNVVYTLRVVTWWDETVYLLVGRAYFHTVKNLGDGPRWRLLELRGFERPDLP